MDNYHQNCYKFGKYNKSNCFWFTGLQCSGKTTIAKKFCEFVPNSILLDGDAIRTAINYDLGFSKDDVSKNLLKVSNLCRLLMDQGYNVLVSCVSKFKDDRRRAKEIIGDKYKEIYVFCNSNDLLQRRNLLHKNTKVLFDDYEYSDYDVYTLNTSLMTEDECVEKLKNEFKNSWSKE